MKVKDLISKLNYNSNCKIIMKSDLYDAGVKLAWKNQEIICGGKCTVRSFTIENNVLTIYYKPVNMR